MARRDEILEVIFDYAKAHRGNSPSERDLLNEMHLRGYKMGRGTLQVHMLKLRVEGRLDRKDGKLIVNGSEWLSPEENYLPVMRMD